MLDSKQIRKKTIELSCKTGAGHLAPSLSCVEILTVLFRDFLKFNKSNAKDISRDRLIFSKGHGAYSYYIILNELGFLPKEELDTFYNGASIKGCLTQNLDYMIEASTGSLGHGLPIAVGMAQAFKMQKMENKVVCIVGDGEMQEGSNFEALNIASKFNLDNLLVIIDGNKLQAMDKVSDVGLSNNQLANILEAYPCIYDRINGHDEKLLKNVFNNFFNKTNEKFSMVFCDTIKGKGIEFMENSPSHHFRCPTEDGYVLELNND